MAGCSDMGDGGTKSGHRLTAELRSPAENYPTLANRGLEWATRPLHQRQGVKTLAEKHSRTDATISSIPTFAHCWAEMRATSPVYSQANDSCAILIFLLL
jgi:hypothetical protein